jgi:hypothetical protein
MITVVSTANNPPVLAKKRCRQTVSEQMGLGLLGLEHRYFDVAEEAQPRAHFEILRQVCATLPPDRIVVSLDGDDWLARPDALAIVQKYHDAGAWVTWGSFRFADGRAGFAEWVNPREARKRPWVQSHLKTFRAGLFMKVKAEHLKRNDVWLPHARDLALMFPLGELAGAERCAWIPEVLSVYNYGSSTEFVGPESVRRDERDCVAYVRALPVYERVEVL